MSSLQRRLLTAAVLIPLVVWVVLALPTPYLAGLLGLLALGGAWEWACLMGWTSALARWSFVASVGAGLAVLALVATPGTTSPLAVPLMTVALVWWAAAVVWVVRVQSGADAGFPRATAVRVLVGWLVLVPAWAALVELHGSGDDGPARVMFLMLLIWTADSGAYFAGRRWGATRLASRVSPGKTWEGVAGGAAAVALLTLAALAVLHVPGPRTVLFVLLCLLTVPVSILGDLAESLFKRMAGVKDSGRLLPGHGGVLDRVDSLTAAAPFFTLGLYWLGTGA